MAVYFYGFDTKSAPCCFLHLLLFHLSQGFKTLKCITPKYIFNQDVFPLFGAQALSVFRQSLFSKAYIEMWCLENPPPVMFI